MLNTVSLKPLLLHDVGNSIDTCMAIDEANAVLVSALAAHEPDDPVFILADKQAGEVFKRGE